MKKVIALNAIKINDYISKIYEKYEIVTNYNHILSSLLDKYILHNNGIPLLQSRYINGIFYDRTYGNTFLMKFNNYNDSILKAYYDDNNCIKITIIDNSMVYTPSSIDVTMGNNKPNKNINFKYFILQYYDKKPKIIINNNVGNNKSNDKEIIIDYDEFLEKYIYDNNTGIYIHTADFYKEIMDKNNENLEIEFIDIIEDEFFKKGDIDNRTVLFEYLFRNLKLFGCDVRLSVTQLINNKKINLFPICRYNFYDFIYVYYYDRILDKILYETRSVSELNLRNINEIEVFSYTPLIYDSINLDASLLIKNSIDDIFRTIRIPENIEFIHKLILFMILTKAHFIAKIDEDNRNYIISVKHYDFTIPIDIIYASELDNETYKILLDFIYFCIINCSRITEITELDTVINSYKFRVVSHNNKKINKCININEKFDIKNKLLYFIRENGISKILTQDSNKIDIDDIRNEIVNKIIAYTLENL